MNKPLSTYERKMKNSKFRKAIETGYKEMLLIEILIAIMEKDDDSIRELIKTIQKDLNKEPSRKQIKKSKRRSK